MTSSFRKFNGGEAVPPPTPSLRADSAFLIGRARRQ
jgi:hypothetical protein